MNATAQATTDAVQFADLSTEELRAMAAKTHSATPWSKYDRAQLLAFFQNRFGRYVPS